MSAGFTPPILRACPTSRGCICTPHAALRRHQLLQCQIFSRKGWSDQHVHVWFGNRCLCGLILSCQLCAQEWPEGES